MTLPTGLKGRFVTPFPSRVLSGSGIAVAKTGGVYTISQDIESLQAALTIDAADRDNFYFTLYDEESESFLRANIDVLLAAIVVGIDETLGAIAGLTGAANKGLYFTGTETAALYDLTAGGRALSGLTGAVDKLPYFTGSADAATTDLTAFARTLIDDANAAAARTTLGLVIGTDVQAYHGSTRAQTGAAYTYVTGDANVTVLRSNAGTAMTDTLPTGTLAANTLFAIQNNDAAALWSGTTSAKLDGVTGGILYLGPGQSAQLHFDGTDYRTLSKPNRCRLGANTTVYVNIAESDANVGITAAEAWATPTFAYNTIRDRFDLNGYVLTVQMADGAYGNLSAVGAVVGCKNASSLIFQGNAGTPSNVTFAAVASIAIQASSGARLWLRGLLVSSTNLHGIVAVDAGTSVRVDAVDFSHCPLGSQMYLSNYSQMTIVGNYNLSAEADIHITAAFAFFDSEGAYTFTFINGFSYNYSAFVRSDFGALLDHKNATWALAGGASVTGKRYTANANSIIHGTGSTTYFPGNAAGTTAGGAYYD